MTSSVLFVSELSNFVTVLIKRRQSIQAWWLSPVIPALRQSQENQEFKVIFNRTGVQGQPKLCEILSQTFSKTKQGRGCGEGSVSQMLPEQTRRPGVLKMSLTEKCSLAAHCKQDPSSCLVHLASMIVLFSLLHQLTQYGFLFSFLCSWVPSGGSFQSWIWACFVLSCRLEEEPGIAQELGRHF